MLIEPMGKEGDFLEACREGNVIKVEHLLSASKNRKYIVPLFSKTASELLQSKDVRGSTALHLASLNGRKAVVYLLLDEGADVSVADENGCLALHLASWNGHLDIASALISRDPRQETINAVTKNQETPLHFAAQYGHSNVVSLLLRNGAQLSLRNNKGETPLDLAAKFGRLEAVRCLLDANPHMVLNALVADPNQADAQLPPPFSPLHLAAKNGKTEVVRLLLDAGFDVNFFTEEGTALHVAALYGKIDAVKLLLERGVNADARDFHGRTALKLLEEHQLEKPVLLSHLLPNRDAWQHCSSMIHDHIERASDASTVSKEVAAIYMNAIQRQQERQFQENAKHAAASESAIWLPIPSNSHERINFERGIDRSPASTIESSKRTTKPLSILTNFHVPPPPPSTECGSICSTISLTATPTPSPSCVTPSTISSQGGHSPRFPLDGNFVMSNIENDKKESKNPPKDTTGVACTYQPVPIQYDNVPTPGPYPQTTYDNVPTNVTGYDNAPPPNVHAWSHTCCKAADNGVPCTTTKENDDALGKVQNENGNREAAIKIEVNGGNHPAVGNLDTGDETRKNGHCASRTSNDGVGNSVKFADSPPETLYLPVEAKLYTRMDQPLKNSSFRPVVVGTAVDALVANTKDSGGEELKAAVVCEYGPYDNVPFAHKATLVSQEKSPDFCSSEVDQDFNSMKIIDQTIQVIEQSSKDIEDNVDAIIRCPSRSSNATGSRPVTPPSPVKKPPKIPPPVSPKPKLLWVARAPLAQPEADDLLTSADSFEFKTALFPGIVVTPVSSAATDSEKKATHKRCHHRSLSRQRSSAGQEQLEKLVGSTVPDTSTTYVNTSNLLPTPKRSYVDSETQADTGTASSDCCGSLCSCSGGSQCSLANSLGSEVSSGRNSVPAAEDTGDVVSPIDEQAEWNKIDAIFKSCGSRIARLSTFESEIKPEFSTYLNSGRMDGDGGDQANENHTQLASPSKEEESNFNAANTVEQWLRSIGLKQHVDVFVRNGFDRLDFLNVTLDSVKLRSLGISRPDEVEMILTEAAKLPQPKSKRARNFRYVSDWLQAYGCQDYLGQFVKSGYDTIWKILHLEVEDVHRLFSGTLLLGHRLRLAWSLADDSESSISKENEPKSQNSNGVGLRLNSFPSDEGVSRGDTKFDSATTFAAHYLGSTLIDNATGMEATKMSMMKLKKSTKEITKVPQVVLEISSRGVRVYDSATRRSLCEHAVQNIHCVCQDERDLNCFAYISKDGARHFCHVYSVLTADIATELILTLGKAFDVAYQKALDSVAF